MFTEARIKLTAWYCLIIMSISIIFSVVIYNRIDREFDRIDRVSQLRIEQERELGIFLRSAEIERPAMVAQAREHLVVNLILANLAILGLSAFAGYFLAGRTLRPIEEMIDEQNRFISDSSHELRTPLTSLKTSIEVNLRDKKLTLEKAKEILRSNLDEVNTLNLLSDELIQLVQFQKSGKLKFENLKVRVLISRAVKMIEPLAMNKNIKLLSNVEEQKVYGDEKALVELFTIFLENAVKYSPKNTAINISSEKKNTCVEILIEDQGYGIDKKDLPYIFDRFYRAEKSRSKIEAHGYGLGLAIAKKIIDAHKGHISVESEKDKGTKFKISLPK